MERRTFLKFLGIGMGILTIPTTFYSFGEVLVPQNLAPGTMEMMERAYQIMLKNRDIAIGVPKGLKGDYISHLLQSDPLNRFHPDLGVKGKANHFRWSGTSLVYKGEMVLTNDVMKHYRAAREYSGQRT